MPGESDAAAVVTDKTVYVTLTVHFRERPLIQTWPGVCNTNDANEVHCSIIPHKDQDTVDQGLTIRGDMAGYTLAVTSDCQVFRNPVQTALVSALWRLMIEFFMFRSCT